MSSTIDFAIFYNELQYMSQHRQYFTLGRNSTQIIRDGSFPTKKEHLENQLFNHHVAQNNIRIQNLLRRLHASYIHEKIPEFYGYFFLGQLVTASEERIQDSLIREMQLLRTKQCHYNFIMKTLNARQSNIKSLQRCLESIFQQNQKDAMLKFNLEIGHYRKLTVLVIEQIKQWKQYLLNINPNPYGDDHIAFFFQGNDYLLKILNDTDFIGQSFLSSKVTFSYKQDPFIMRPYTETQNGQNQYTELFKFSLEERTQYVRALQFLAHERADYVQRKLSVKEERIKDIERAYQTKSVHNKILVTRPHLNLLKKSKEEAYEAPIDFVDESRLKSSSKATKRSRSLNQLREGKFRDFLIKGQKMRRIKEMKFGQPAPMINSNKFATIEPSETQKSAPMNKSISLSFLKTSPLKKQQSQLQAKPTEFESMLREKELQILEKDNKQRRTFSSVKLNDRLSERKLINGQEGAEQLHKILEQLEHSAPHDQGFIKRRVTSSRMGKSMMQHNEQAMVTLRKSVLKEIEDHETIRKQIEKQKEEEREQMQRIIKDKLNKQTLLNLKQQKSKWTQGKDLLAHELGKKEIFGYSDPTTHKSQKLTELEMDLKKEMQMKWLREVHEELLHRQQMNKMEKQKKREEEKLLKQFETAKRKQEQEKRFQQIEQQERFKVEQEQLNRQKQRQRQIEQQMKAVVQRERQKLETYSLEQKVKLESEMRDAAKVNLLKKLRREKSLYRETVKAEENRKLQQDAHRAQIKKKIQASFEVEKQLERQRQREEKNKKLMLVAQKIQHVEKQLQQQKLQKKKSMIKPEELQSLRSSIVDLPDPRKSKIVPFRQEHKKKMRQQFELQLFAFNRPEQFTQQDNFLVKEFKSKLDNQQNLNARIQQLQEQIEKDKQAMELYNAKAKQKEETVKQSAQSSIPPKASSLKADRQSSQISNQFVRFSETKSEKNKPEEGQPSLTETDLKKLGIDMSPVQYMMYIKKKAAIDAKRIAPTVNEQKEKKKVKKILDQFEIMEGIERQPYTKIEQQQLLIENIQDEQNYKAKKQEQPKPQTLEGIDQPSPMNDLNKKVQKEQSDNLSDIMKLTVHSKIDTKKQKKFVTSDQQSQDESPRKKKTKKRKISQKQQPEVARSKKSMSQHSSPKKPKQHQLAHFKQVPLEQLDQYLIDHFKKISKLTRKLNLFRKDELLKMLLELKNLMIVEVTKGAQIEGIGFASQNENKQAIRSLNIMHVGAYDDSNTINVLIKVRDLIFSVDPCAQLTYSMYYGKEDQEQLNFIKDFQKKFDPYGAIFQKKINNEQSERKHVMRRMIGQESTNTLLEKSNGQIKISENLLVNASFQSLGLELGLNDIGTTLGGWTLLSLFLSKYGDSQQIQAYLDADVKQYNKNIKYLSRMASKLKDNKIQDIEYFQFDNPFQTNLKLIEQHVDILKCDPQIQQSDIPIKRIKASISVQPVLPFVSTTCKIRHQDDEMIINYLRYNIGKGTKVVKLKSNSYSSQIIVIPCKPSNYKLLVAQAAEFDTLKNVSLDLYMKLFLANVDKHTLSVDQHIWIPQFQSEQIKKIELAEQFNFNTELRSKSSMKFTQYVSNCISYAPHHRDILVTPPFLIAALNSEIQRLTESSPIFIERIGVEKMMGVKTIPKPPVESDF